MNEFRRKILKLDEPRHHKIRNSYGVYDAFKYYRKNRPQEKKYVLTESQYMRIVRQINLRIVDSLLQGNDITFPHRMGSLELRKRHTTVEIVDGKLKDNLPIDWDSTLKLWSEDKESYKNKTLVKLEVDEVFRVRYVKYKANYNNKVFYKFTTNRLIKQKLRDKINNNSIDAFDLWHNNSKV